MSTRLKLGDQCPAPECGFELHGIDGSTLKEAVETLRPALHSPSLPKRVRAGRIPASQTHYVICPRCDAYALGIEMVQGFPIRAASGDIICIQTLERRLGSIRST